jgi:hypothetical protein
VQMPTRRAVQEPVRFGVPPGITLIRIGAD